MDLKGLFSVQNFSTDLTRVWESIWEMFGLHVHHNTVLASVGKLKTQTTCEPRPVILRHKLLKVLRCSDIWEIEKLGWHRKNGMIPGWIITNPCAWLWRGACGRWLCPGRPHKTDTGNWMCWGSVWTRHGRGCPASWTWWRGRGYTRSSCSLSATHTAQSPQVWKSFLNEE